MFPFLPPSGDRELACSVASVMSDSVTPWTVDHQAPLSMGILRAKILEWVAMGDLPNPGIEAGSPALKAGSLLLIRSPSATPNE